MLLELDVFGAFLGKSGRSDGWQPKPFGCSGALLMKSRIAFMTVAVTCFSLSCRNASETLKPGNFVLDPKQTVLVAGSASDLIPPRGHMLRITLLGNNNFELNPFNIKGTWVAKNKTLSLKVASTPGFLNLIEGRTVDDNTTLTMTWIVSGNDTLTWIPNGFNGKKQLKLVFVRE